MSQDDYFIADLHLCEQQPQISEWFKFFIRNQARQARNLYILGDLFEYWLGDDMLDATAKMVSDELQQLAQHGVRTFFMAGNRDFLLGEKYAHRAGIQIITEPHLISLHGKPTLLIHGDAECTDDTAYQQARKTLRNPQWQAQFLAQSPEQRIAFAKQARQQSQQHNQATDQIITDVNQQAIEQQFTKHQAKQIIHGHTHRPAIHHHPQGTRFVLGDWFQQSSYLIATPNGLELIQI